MDNNQKYTKIFLDPIKKCKNYKPKCGDGNNKAGTDLQGFLKLYGSDPFYSWIGLNSTLMYAAHKAAGGMTSIYRQIGVGCENLFRQIIRDTTEYEDKSFATWSYTAKTSSGKSKTLSLDGRLELNEIRNLELKDRLEKWIQEYCSELSVNNPPNGIVFEVRQGYKSKDSKRQNADIDNATVAWANGYLPIFAIFSSQIDSDIVLRYKNNRCGIMIGMLSDNSKISLFSFCKDVLGYDLARFFETNSEVIREQVLEVLKVLLDADGN